jgi:PAS domain S-box-containing protein
VAPIDLSKRTRLVIALLLPFVALGLQWLLWPVIQPFAWFLFFPTVFFSAWIGGRRGGIAATVISAGIVWYFFLAPQLSWAVANPNNLWFVGVFVITGVFFAEVQERLERARHDAALAREESESKFKAVVEQSLAGIYILQDGVVQYANPYYAQMFGYDSPDELVGKVRAVDLVVREDRAEAEKQIGGRVSGEVPVADFTLRGRRRDGRSIDLELHSSQFELGGRPAVIGVAINASERLDAERRLREQETILARTSAIAHIGGWEFDARTGAGQWNAEVARIHDLDPSVQPSVSVGLSYYTQDSRPVMEKAVADAVAHGTPYDLELEIESAKGVSKWVRTTGQPVVEDGRVVRVEGTTQDITERKHAELARAASEMQYQGLFDSLLEGVAHCEMLFDEDGNAIDWRYLDVNPAFPRITGLDGIRGKLVSEAIPGISETNPELFRIYGDVAKTGLPAEFETFVPLLARGQWLHVGVTRPAPGQFVALFNDITERREAEIAIQESEQRYRLLVEQSPDGIFLADAEGNYLDVNPCGAEMLGYRVDEVPGLTFLDVLDPSEIARLQPDIELLEAGATTRNEWLFRRKDGSTFFGEVVGLQLPNGNLQGILRDVTGRKAAEEAIQELNASLERRVEQRTAEVVAANKELESFSYTVSHDLRAPLRAMSGFSQALLEDCGDALDEKAREYLDHIIAGSRKMGALIDGLLTLSRATRGELARQTVDVSAMAESLFAEKASQQPQRQITWCIEPGITVEADPRMVEIVMRNLLGNAWKYTGKTQEAHVDVTACVEGDEHGICVADNGAGFDSAYADQLFHPFQRLHTQDEFPGIGIGLATVKRIAERHGGSVSAQASPGMGATFRVWLPDSAATQ